MMSELYILTGAVQSGKTTSLIKWSKEKTGVYGIVTPVVEGKRFFMNVHTGQIHPMEASPAEKEVLSIGRFVFSKAAFEKAEQIIRNAVHTKGWLIIDEIGPLELKGKGFATLLKELLQQQSPDQKIIVVVREGLVQAVKDFFGLNTAVIINNPFSLPISTG